MKLEDINSLNEQAEAVIAQLQNNTITKEEAMVVFEDIINKITGFLGKKNKRVEGLQQNFKRLLLKNEKYKEFKENLKILKEKEIALSKELGFNL